MELRPNHLPVRVFLLEKLIQTNFIKDSPGGMREHNLYLNVEKLKVNGAHELAQKLDGKKWSEFGRKK